MPMSTLFASSQVSDFGVRNLGYLAGLSLNSCHPPARKLGAGDDRIRATASLLNAEPFTLAD
jgi:hypothetical protein